MAGSGPSSSRACLVAHLGPCCVARSVEYSRTLPRLLLAKPDLRARYCARARGDTVDPRPMSGGRERFAAAQVMLGNVVAPPRLVSGAALLRSPLLSDLSNGVARFPSYHCCLPRSPPYLSVLHCSHSSPQNPALFNKIRKIFEFKFAILQKCGNLKPCCCKSGSSKRR